MFWAKYQTPLSLGCTLSPGLYIARLGAPAGERKRWVWSINRTPSTWHTFIKFAVEQEAASFMGCRPKGGMMEEA